VDATLDRPAHLRRALQLTGVTIGWNVVEGVVAVTAALAAGSVALLGFGIDSFVETSSGGIVLWRLLAERRAVSREAVQELDRTAHRLIGASLVALAAVIAVDATHALLRRERPEASVVGIVLTVVSIIVMMWLARAKRATAVALGSHALKADALQTSACWWLSITTLSGIALNALLGWWWADPVAAIGMVFLLLREGREAWRGDPCC
jgi:divalent metal cation (Fe/Co/Zn/Cd) transporter